MELAKKYVSTTYAVLFIIFFTVLLIVLFVDNFINWSDILKIDIAYNEELKVVLEYWPASFVCKLLQVFLRQCWLQIKSLHIHLVFRPVVNFLHLYVYGF